jgi:hypothetical protein
MCFSTSRSIDARINNVPVLGNRRGVFLPINHDRSKERETVLNKTQRNSLGNETAPENYFFIKVFIYLSASYRGEELERATKPEKALEIA